MQGVTEGRIVHFVLPNGDHRAAMIVRVFPGIDDGTVNLMVFLDGDNDTRYNIPTNFSGFSGAASGFIPFRWETSVHYAEEHEPRTWHWIEPA